MVITLPSLLVAYQLYSRVLVADPNAGRNCRGGNIYIPTAAAPDSVAANAGVVVDYGGANAGLTDIAQPELPAMVEGFNYNIPQDIRNSYSLTTRWIQASVDNAVIWLELLYS